LEGVYTLLAEVKSGGGLVSKTSSQLKSPGEIGETVYENFTGKSYDGENAALMTQAHGKIKLFFRKNR